MFTNVRSDGEVLCETRAAGLSTQAVTYTILKDVRQKFGLPERRRKLVRALPDCR